MEAGGKRRGNPADSRSTQMSDVGRPLIQRRGEERWGAPPLGDEGGAPAWSQPGSTPDARARAHAGTTVHGDRPARARLEGTVRGGREAVRPVAGARAVKALGMRLSDRRVRA